MDESGLDLACLSSLQIDGEEVERIDYNLHILYKRVHPCGVRIMGGGEDTGLSVEVEQEREVTKEYYADRHFVASFKQDRNLAGTWKRDLKWYPGAQEFSVERGVMGIHGISLSGGAGDVSLVADDDSLTCVGKYYGSVYSTAETPLFAADTLPRVTLVDLSKAKLTTVGNHALAGYRGELRLPGTVAKIGTRAFVGAGWFAKEVNLGGVTELSYAALEGTGIVSVTAPDVTLAGLAEMSEVERIDISESPMTTLRHQTFMNCPKLREVLLPNGLQKVQGTSSNTPFKGCTSLERIVMPGSLTAISNYALRYCPGLKVLDLCTNSDLSTLVTLSGTNQFEDAPADYRILVPRELYDRYVADTKWSVFKNHIEAGER